jgi:hypothetical protein
VTTRRIALETWEPEYGAPADATIMEPSDISINTEVELPESHWKPIEPPASLLIPDDVLFIDGVRRIDAYAWITQGNELPFRSILASYAAGIAMAGRYAKVTAAEARRVLVASTETTSLVTRAGEYMPQMTTGNSPEELSLALQNRLTNLEIEIAKQAHGEAEIIVIDGPLRGRQDIDGAVGYVKTHRVSYLPDHLQPVVANLQAGHRTPVFMFTTSWSRYSWYLRLPGAAQHTWWGIVRMEAAEDLTAKQAIERADITSALLPRYASAPHKDPRAPQNLHPIAGLERELRRRLGDSRYVQRALRVATPE